MHPATNRLFVEEIGIEVAIELKIALGFDHVQEHVSIHKLLGIGLDLRRQAFKFDARTDLFEIELHLDQRETACISRNQ